MITRYFKNGSRIQRFQKGKIIYLDYPSYKGNAASGYPGSGVVGAVVGKDAKMRVGHNSFILVDDNGNTEYYEYGRYNKGQTPGGTIIGQYKEGQGNWVRRKVPNVEKDETLDQYMSRLRESGKLPHADQGTVHATFINNANIPNVRNYVTTQANDVNRARYSLVNTCATQAARAINSGLGAGNYATGLFNFATRQLNPKSLLNEAKSVIQSRGWRLVPGSSQAIGQGMSNFGSTKTY